MTNKMHLRLLFLAVVLIVVTLLPMSAYATAGDLDTSFFPPNGYGITSTEYTADSYQRTVWKMAVLSDGKYVVGSGADDTLGNTIELYRHMSDGSVDTSFGNNGNVTFAFSGVMGTSIKSIVVQSDSKILVGGVLNPNHYGGTPIQFIVRFNADGSADNTFGVGGLITYNSGYYATDFNSIALQPDGKIIVVGGYQDGSGHGSMIINRYLSNGTPDGSFGSGGKVVYQDAQYMATQGGKAIVKTDGKILVLGTGLKIVSRNLTSYYLLIQFGPAGALDTSFGSNGVVVELDAINDMGLTPDGKIVTVGDNATSYHPVGCSWITQRALTLRRFLSNGTPDSTFGTEGLLTYADPSLHLIGYNLLVQPDGKITVTVSATTADSMCTEQKSFVDVIARVNSDGTFDSSYKNGGIVVLESIIPGFPSDFVAWPTGIFMQGDGRITAMYSGYDNTVTGVTDKIVTLRLMGDPPVMPIPTTQQIFPTYPAVETPNLSIVPADLQPIGVGQVATEGINGYSLVDINMSLPQFPQPMDIYLLLYFPTYSPNILFWDASGLIGDTTQALATPYLQVAPTDNINNLSILQGFQALPGEYFVAVLAAPTGQFTLQSISLTNPNIIQATGPYYMWITHWTISQTPVL